MEEDKEVTLAPNPDELYGKDTLVTPEEPIIQTISKE